MEWDGSAFDLFDREATTQLCGAVSCLTPRCNTQHPMPTHQGLSKCGQGGASAAVDNCANIPPAEFVK